MSQPDSRWSRELLYFRFDPLFDKFQASQYDESQQSYPAGNYELVQGNSHSDGAA